MALRYNMSDQDMKDLLGSPYEFAKEKIKNLDLSNIKTEEQLKELKTNFMFTSFFKLVIEWQTVKNKLTRKEHINNLNDKQWKK